MGIDEAIDEAFASVSDPYLRAHNADLRQALFDDVLRRAKEIGWSNGIAADEFDTQAARSCIESKLSGFGY